LWKCDCLPSRKGEPQGNDTQFIAAPVVVGDRLYLGLGASPGGPRMPPSTYFLCLDITGTGDVSLKSYDGKAAANKGSALVWAFGGATAPRPERGRIVNFGSTGATAAVYQGLVYITETTGYLHCLDAVTGNRIWVYDLATELHGSPYLVDGRVYVGSGDGEVVVFGHTRAARIHATIDMDEEIHTTPVAANGTLYVATRSKLYAIAR
jgi:outer membrane protein assembly factor BamB